MSWRHYSYHLPNNRHYSPYPIYTSSFILSLSTLKLTTWWQSVMELQSLLTYTGKHYRNGDIDIRSKVTYVIMLHNLMTIIFMWRIQAHEHTTYGIRSLISTDTYYVKGAFSIPYVDVEVGSCLQPIIMIQWNTSYPITYGTSDIFRDSLRCAIHRVTL